MNQEIQKSEEKGAIIPKNKQTPLHILSGGAILGLDWALFTGNLATGGMATLAVSLAGFTLGSAAVTATQHFLAGDSWRKSLIKGAGAGIAVGIPMPIAGTALGGAILGWSGLSLLKGKFPGK